MARLQIGWVWIAVS